MYLLCLTGLLGITVTGDAFNAFVFLEISSLSTYVLIALGRDRRALLAAFQYLIMGTIGATFYVIGVGLLYLVDRHPQHGRHCRAPWRRPGPSNSRPIIAALAFITVGISLKLALFPLHVWLPNAYAYAPSWATAFLSATATKVAIYLLVRFLFSIFGVAIELQRSAGRRDHRRAVARRDVHRLADRGVRAQPEAHARLFFASRRSATSRSASGSPIRPD